jgi:hypothetical protein
MRGYYPAYCKVARVRPVFKSRDPTEFSNNQLIKVLPVLSQVFERILQVRILGFLDLQGVINPGQYGFRSGHSTMVIHNMVDRVRGAWDSRGRPWGYLQTSRRHLKQDPPFKTGELFGG